MAASCFRFIRRSSASLSPSIKSSIRSNAPKSPVSKSTPFPLAPKPNPSPSSFSRTPSELGCVQSLLPLHSAVAVARMTSCLSETSSSCRALSQGILCCTSPSL